MARGSRTVGLRPFLPADVAALTALYRASVEELAAEDYDDAQRKAWASAVDDAAAFGAKLAGELAIVAVSGGEIVGFASLKDNTHFDMLYVRPDFARRGVGAALADAIEKLAGGRGTASITVDASDVARDFFVARGYTAQRRNTVTIAGQWLGNTTMTRQLTAPSTTKH